MRTVSILITGTLSLFYSSKPCITNEAKTWDQGLKSRLGGVMLMLLLQWEEV